MHDIGQPEKAERINKWFEKNESKIKIENDLKYLETNINTLYKWCTVLEDKIKKLEENKMEVLSQKQIVELLDKLNKDSFEYIGVMHIRSGYIPEVEAHNMFIKELNAKPIKEIEMRDPLTEREEREKRWWVKNAIVVNVSPGYVNIYRVNDVEHKIKNISKEKCIMILQWRNE